MVAHQNCHLSLFPLLLPLPLLQHLTKKEAPAVSATVAPAKLAAVE
jgi:hypothetical protein